MKHPLITLGLIAALLMAYWLYSSGPDAPADRGAPVEPDRPAKPAAAQTPAPDTQLEDDGLWDALQSIFSRLTAPEEEAAPPEDSGLWTVLSRDADISPVTSFDHEQYPDAMLLEISDLRATQWHVGKEVTFTIPQTGYQLTTQVEELEEPFPGITVVKSYPDESLANHMLVTIGQKNTFVNLFTPDGEFEMIGNERHGWIVPSSSLPGPTEDDMIILDPPTFREEPRR